MILNQDKLIDYVEKFNTDDYELYRQSIPNSAAADFLRGNVPLFDCPDAEIEEIYYFRWWTFRKHIKNTEDGYVITEFLPEVHWAGKHNAIGCPAGHQFREGRWLRDRQIMRDYAVYWLRKDGEPRRYSFWIADSILAYANVTGDRDLAIDLLPELVSNYEAWESSHRGENGLYWQEDDRDGMECSISGRLAPDYTGYRATINSYMFGDALAIAAIADWAGRDSTVETYRGKAAEIRQRTEDTLWDEEARFFKVLPRTDNASLSDVRELHGYTPWYFNLPSPKKSHAWAQLMDPQGFEAPFGPTTAEQRHPRFAVSYTGHHCQWNGPSWPFATSITLTALANVLNDYDQDVVTSEDYFKVLKTYTKCHRMKLDDGRLVPWIDENLNPFTGEWLCRTFEKKWEDGKADPEKREERGKDYNHSTYCDHIINGLVGLRPRIDDTVEVNPLLPARMWDYFCLDGVHYHGRELSVVWDRTGEKYGLGQGLTILVDGAELVHSANLERTVGKLQ